MAFADCKWIITGTWDLVLINKKKKEMVFKIWDVKLHRKEMIQGQKSS